MSTWACSTASGLGCRCRSGIDVRTGCSTDLRAGLLAHMKLDALARTIAHLAVGNGFSIAARASATHTCRCCTSTLMFRPGGWIARFIMVETNCRSLTLRCGWAVYSSIGRRLISGGSWSRGRAIGGGDTGLKF